jgi:hypothetical protein
MAAMRGHFPFYESLFRYCKGSHWSPYFRGDHKKSRDPFGNAFPMHLFGRTYWAKHCEFLYGSLIEQDIVIYYLYHLTLNYFY